MKRLLAAAFLIGAACFGYRTVEGWKAYTAYERFADAWTRGDKEAALNYGTEKAVTHALEERALRGTRSGTMMEAFRGSTYAVESKTRSPEGGFVLHVKQTIFFDPPGITSGIGGAMLTHFRHEATVSKGDSGWKVTAFEPTYLDMGEIRRHR